MRQRGSCTIRSTSPEFWLKGPTLGLRGTKRTCSSSRGLPANRAPECMNLWKRTLGVLLCHLGITPEKLMTAGMINERKNFDRKTNIAEIMRKPETALTAERTRKRLPHVSLWTKHLVVQLLTRAPPKGLKPLATFERPPRRPHRQSSVRLQRRLLCRLRCREGPLLLLIPRPKGQRRLGNKFPTVKGSVQGKARRVDREALTTNTLAGTRNLTIMDSSICPSRRRMLILNGENRDVMQGKSLFAATRLETFGKLIESDASER